MPSAPPPSHRPPPDSADADDGGSFALRFGTGVGAAAVASALAAIPATLRVAHDSSAGAVAWIACVGVMIFPMLVAVLLLRRARVGLRAIGGTDASARMLGVALWLFGLFLFEAAFGSVLRATTHHHALAGTTFAIVSLGVAVVLGVVCARLSSIISARSVGVRRFLLVAIAGLLALAIVVAALRFSRAIGAGGGSSPGPLLVDLLAFGIAALFASRPSLAQRRGLALAGPPIAIAFLGAGLWSVHGSAAIASAIAAHAPALAPIAALVGGH